MKQSGLLDIMGSGVNDTEEEHSVGKLSVEPDILIERDEPNLRAKKPHDRPAYWHQDEHSIESQYQPGSSRHPD
jgi:hypothetical protein